MQQRTSGTSSCCCCCCCVGPFWLAIQKHTHTVSVVGHVVVVVSCSCHRESILFIRESLNFTTIIIIIIYLLFFSLALFASAQICLGPQSHPRCAWLCVCVCVSHPLLGHYTHGRGRGIIRVEHSEWRRLDEGAQPLMPIAQPNFPALASDGNEKESANRARRDARRRHQRERRPARTKKRIEKRRERRRSIGQLAN